MPDLPQVKAHHAVFTSLTAGALAGAIAKTTIAPLDRTKINFQVSSTRGYSFKAAFRFLKNSWRTEGALALWRGNSATMVRVVPFAAFQFTAHEQWRRVLHVDREGRSTPFRRYLAGALAGVVATSLTYPLDLARACLAVASGPVQSHSLLALFVDKWRAEGTRRLYRGIVPTLVGSFAYSGSGFFIYESLKLDHFRRKERTVGPHQRVAMGAVAGIVAQVSSYPLDIVRRRLQTGKTIGQSTHVLGMLRHIWRTEGLRRGLYKGVSMNLIKGPIAVGISFATFDSIVRFLRHLPYFRDS